MIVCEGPSDNIYLKHAIRRLAEDFPELADGPKGSIQLKVRLFRRPKSNNIARIMGLRSGGGSVLSNIVTKYLTIAKRFSGPGPVHPMIVLYDNDAGGRKVAHGACQFAKITTSYNEPFVFIGPNVYLVGTPKLQDKDSCIEDLFKDDVKSVTLDGKRLNCANRIDETKEYGKMRLATKVVEPRADTIDFSGFRPLLTSLASAISDYYKQIEPVSLTA